MIDTLYVNGCSWSAGDEIECDPLFEEYLKNNNLSFMKGNKRKIFSNGNEHDLIDIKQWQLSNIIKLRAAGLEDISL